MSASNAFQSDLLKLIFQNLAIANIGNSGGLLPSSVAGNLYIALHTADPGAAGTQATSEAAYTGYARAAVVRSSGTWTISGASPTEVVNAAQVTFGLCTAGDETETFFSVGSQSSGATEILFKAALSAPLDVSNGITPDFPAGDLVVTVN